MNETRLNKSIVLESIYTQPTKKLGKGGRVFLTHWMRVVPADGWPVEVRIPIRLYNELKEAFDRESQNEAQGTK